MQAIPEQPVIDKNKRMAERYRSQAGHVLLSTKFNTQSGRLLAIFSDDAALGSMWVPVQARSAGKDEAKALCAWFNSTLGTLGFLMNRSTMLTNPSFSQGSLGAMPVPDFRKLDIAPLLEAYEQTKNVEVQPWKHAANNEFRDILDRSAAKTIGIDIETIRDWRQKISREPTISNQRAEVDS